MRALCLSMALSALVFAQQGTRANDGLNAIAGQALFERLWVPSPASTDASDGLGPLFNARSCATCHPRASGARVVVQTDGRRDISGAVVRFGDSAGKVDPFYGLQLQTNAVPGLKPEGSVQYLPTFNLQLNGPRLAADTRKSVRLAPSLTNRAHFDDVDDADILQRADPDDRDGDGISGRANMIDNRIGRFGWKSAHPTLKDQIAHAFAFDLGLSSPTSPHPFGDCTTQQKECLGAPTGESALFDGREVSNQMLELVAEYLKSLPPPAPQADDRGSALFSKSGCEVCHTPVLKTRHGSEIRAYSDLLLHDMGPDLDDGVGEPGVASSEWRTAPLTNSYPSGTERRYLHDGSAKTIAEAIAKHGGEASQSRAEFENLSNQERQNLIDFVMGL
ncbi:MAG: hypothetical protein CTY31_09655 [Hyphomicrobium sp.]|nr:MAG: hypothetical protein CTY31_09655 [Hyphomicrobium sp.]